MLPETLTNLTVPIIAGALVSVAMFAIFLLAKALNKEVQPDTKERIVKIAAVVAGLLFGLWTILTPDQQMAIDAFYQQWRPVFEALVVAFGGGGLFWVGNQGAYRIKKAVEPKA